MHLRRQNLNLKAKVRYSSFVPHPRPRFTNRTWGTRPMLLFGCVHKMGGDHLPSLRPFLANKCHADFRSLVSVSCFN